jgi:hypothetical protein
MKDTFCERVIGILHARVDFGYSMFPGVMLASSMHSPDHFSGPATAFTSFSTLILLNHDE